MKKVKTIIGIIVVLIAAFFYAHIAKANEIYDRSVDSSEFLRKLLSRNLSVKKILWMGFLQNVNFRETLPVCL